QPGPVPVGDPAGEAGPATPGDDLVGGRRLAGGLPVDDRDHRYAPSGLTPPAPLSFAAIGVGGVGFQGEVCVARAGSWGPATAEAGGQAAALGRATLGTAPPVGGDTGGTAASGSRPVRVTTPPRWGRRGWR